MRPLTPAQARAMFYLLRCKAIGRLADKGKQTDDDGELRPWCLRVNGRAVRVLVDLGYARGRCFLPFQNREVKGADLLRFFGYWVQKFEITSRGKRAWVHASARERYGLPAFATVKS